MELKRERDEMTAGVDRLNGLLGWWGVQGNQAVEDRIKRFQQLTIDLQRAYGEACSDHVGALNAANDRMSKSFQGLLRSRKPDEFLVAQMDILAALMETASHQVTTWSELGKKVQNCCATVARGAADDLRHQSQQVAAKTEESAREEEQRARRAAK